MAQLISVLIESVLREVCLVGVNLHGVYRINKCSSLINQSGRHVTQLMNLPWEEAKNQYFYMRNLLYSMHQKNKPCMMLSSGFER